MLLTLSSIRNKGSFLGSIINKYRQVVHKTPTAKPLKINQLPEHISTPPTTTTISSNHNNNNNNAANDDKHRPNITANFATKKKSIEERLGIPVKPRKPLTPYFRFMVNERPKLLASNPNAHITEISVQISKKWETIDSNLKQQLFEDYKRDREVYLKERSKYDATITEEQRNQIKEYKENLAEAKNRRQLQKRFKELGKPRRPMSGYFRFLAEEKRLTPPSPGQSYTDWRKIVTNKWTRLPDNQRNTYLEECRNDFKTYKEALNAWEEQMIRLGNSDVIRNDSLLDEPKSKKL